MAEVTEMRLARDKRGLPENEYDLGLIGRVLDERGEAASLFVRERTCIVLEAGYKPEEFQFCLENVDHDCTVSTIVEALSVKPNASVLLDSTTLGVAEIFLLTKALKSTGLNGRIDVLYVEPEEYSEARSSESVLSRRDFELSEDFHNIIPIPGAVALLRENTKNYCAFFLGYEQRRLAHALESVQGLTSDSCYPIFGVPAYVCGWEMHSFANNFRSIVEKGLHGSVYFCPADNPKAAMDRLKEMHAAIPDEGRLFIAPFGTKPHAVGAALFAASYDRVGLLYDHPVKKSKRTRNQ